MYAGIVRFLCCPICKQDFEVIKIEEYKNADENNLTINTDTIVLTGSLTCRYCNKTYPIDDGIPNLVVL